MNTCPYFVLLGNLSVLILLCAQLALSPLSALGKEEEGYILFVLLSKVGPKITVTYIKKLLRLLERMCQLELEQ